MRLFVGLFVALTTCSLTLAEKEPLLFNRAQLEKIRTGLNAGETGFKKPYDRLLRDAEKALEQKPVSVVDKAQTPPSSDKRDYMTSGPYWWPDPKKPNGLPYIRKDGVSNPDSVVDREAWNRLENAISTLVPAWYFSGEKRYAEKATELLRYWFINPPTAMNPNLNFAQGVPGREAGRGTGTIDLSQQMAFFLSHLQLLESSEAWTPTDEAALQSWMKNFLTWLSISPQAKDARNADNNIGAWFDALQTSVALYTGNEKMARDILSKVPTGRYASQIADDGSLPHELERTRSKSYVSMNLRAFLTLASLGDRAGLNLWNAERNEKLLLKTSIDWLVPYVTNQQEWKWKQISDDPADSNAQLFRMASRGYKNPGYEKIAKQLGGDRFLNDPVYLLYPALFSE